MLRVIPFKSATKLESPLLKTSLSTRKVMLSEILHLLFQRRKKTPTPIGIRNKIPQTNYFNYYRTGISLFFVGVGG